MDIPPPSVPDSQLTDWRQTDHTVDSPFSTPLVSVHTHTCVYEESTQRQTIADRTGLDHPWRFFFTSRVRLTPSQPPNAMLTSLLRNRVSAAFVDRLSARGLTDIEKRADEQISVSGVRGYRNRYRAQYHLNAEELAVSRTGDSETEPLCLPIEGYLAIWADDDYHVAGGAYPAGPAESGPATLVEVLDDVLDTTAAREELLSLIDGCGE